MPKIKYCTEAKLQNKTIIVRVDFNVSLNPDHTIANDERIRQVLPTLNYLLQRGNKLILLSHLGNPKQRDPALSLSRVRQDLQSLLPDYLIKLVADFRESQKIFKEQDAKTILLLENIRFYPEEQANSLKFAQELAALADYYVNDAFSASHRPDTSIIGIPKYLPSFGGLLLRKEVEMLSLTLDKPKRPFVVILGGAKTLSKINLIKKLIEKADTVILGGTMANTFLKALGVNIGKSLFEPEALTKAHQLLNFAAAHKTQLVLPHDVITSQAAESNHSEVKTIGSLLREDMILDIGPEAEAQIGLILSQAKTIVWNGPLGYFENPLFRRGTDFLYFMLAENQHAISVIGGGDTLAAVAKKKHLEYISHVSTGGGAMLDFMENGTLPGLEALEKSPLPKPE